MPDLTFKLILVTDDANVKLAEVKQEAQSAQSVVEKPVSVKITAEQALATIRDVKIAVDGVISFQLDKMTNGYRTTLRQNL